MREEGRMASATHLLCSGWNCAHHYAVFARLIAESMEGAPLGAEAEAASARRGWERSVPGLQLLLAEDVSGSPDQRLLTASRSPVRSDRKVR